MPSQLLHTLFGEDVITAIHGRISGRFGTITGKALEKILKTHRKVFALGCQGPDIFYHSRSRRPVAIEYGTLLHRRGAGAFTAELLKDGLPEPPPGEEDIRLGRHEKGINALGVYALGFMTHAVLDRHAHPYIVYKSDWFYPSKPENINRARFHAFFERIIDVLMFKRLKGLEISCWDQEGVLAETCRNPPSGLKEFIVRALETTFPERAGKDEKLFSRVENAFLDCAGFYRMTSPKYRPESEGFFLSDSKQKDYLVYQYPRADFLRQMDFLNLEGKPWYYPAGEEKKDFRSFPEIYFNAVDAAAGSLAAVFASYLEEGFFPVKEAAAAIGNGGLSITDKDGKPCAPCRSDPFPLDKVLEELSKLKGF